MRSLFFTALITGMVYHGHGPHVAVMALAICLATAEAECARLTAEWRKERRND